MVKSRTIRKIILDIAEKIRKNYDPEKIILFGSFAYGKATRDSDIDMLIVKRTRKKSSSVNSSEPTPNRLNRKRA